MALIHELRKQGDWLFERRTWLPIFLMPPVFYLMRDFQYPYQLDGYTWLALCFAVVVLGLFIRSYAVGHAPIGTSGRNTSEGQIAICVNKTGLYSVLRHPLYLGNYFMWLGVVMYPGNWVMALVFTLAFYLYYERIMFAEEAFLRDKFGEEYEEWAARVPAFIPKWSKWQPPAHPVQYKVIIRQEYLGLCSAILLLALLAYVGEWAISGVWTWPTFVNLFVGTGLGMFIVIRFLAKKTKALTLKAPTDSPQGI